MGTKSDSTPATRRMAPTMASARMTSFSASHHAVAIDRAGELHAVGGLHVELHCRGRTVIRDGHGAASLLLFVSTTYWALRCSNGPKPTVPALRVDGQKNGRPFGRPICCCSRSASRRVRAIRRE